GVPAYPDVPNEPLAPHLPQLTHRLEDVLWRDKLDVMAVHQIQVPDTQPPQALLDAGPHPGARIIKFARADPARLGDQEHALPLRAARREGSAEEDLRGAVVGGGVEGADAEG